MNRVREFRRERNSRSLLWQKRSALPDKRSTSSKMGNTILLWNFVSNCRGH